MDNPELWVFLEALRNSGLFPRSVQYTFFPPGPQQSFYPSHWSNPVLIFDGDGKLVSPDYNRTGEIHYPYPDKRLGGDGSGALEGILDFTNEKGDQIIGSTFPKSILERALNCFPEGNSHFVFSLETDIGKLKEAPIRESSVHYPIVQIITQLSKVKGRPTELLVNKFALYVKTNDLPSQLEAPENFVRISDEKGIIAQADRHLSDLALISVLRFDPRSYSIQAGRRVYDRLRDQALSLKETFKAVYGSLANL